MSLARTVGRAPAPPAARARPRARRHGLPARAGRRPNFRRRQDQNCGGLLSSSRLYGLVGFGLVYWVKSRERHELAAASVVDAARRPLVSVAAVRGGAGGRTLTLPGETAAWFEATIYARVNGYVAKWYTDIGDHVRQGQTLAIIDTPELDAQLVAARAQFNAAEAQVRVRVAEAALATTTYERWRDSPKGVVSDQEREEKKADFDSAEARLNAARAQVALNQADVDHYVALTEFKRVTAPFDGTVVERRIDIGNLVTAGSTAATSPLYRISQDRPMKLADHECNLNAQERSRTETGSRYRWCYFPLCPCWPNGVK